MAINEKLTDRVREAISHVPKVLEKRMFRGITFMVNGKMCVSVGNDELMCRIDPLIHDEMVEKEGVRPLKMKGREYKGFIYVQEDHLRTKKSLDHWVGLALEFNKTAKASKKKK